MKTLKQTIFLRILLICIVGLLSIADIHAQPGWQWMRSIGGGYRVKVVKKTDLQTLKQTAGVMLILQVVFGIMWI